METAFARVSCAPSEAAHACKADIEGKWISTQLERFFTAKIARIEAPASEDAGKPMAGKVSPFQLVE